MKLSEGNLSWRGRGDAKFFLFWLQRQNRKRYTDETQRGSSSTRDFNFINLSVVIIFVMLLQALLSSRFKVKERSLQYVFI